MTNKTTDRKQLIREYNSECGWDVDDDTKVRRMAWIQDKWMADKGGRTVGESLAAMEAEAIHHRTLHTLLVKALKRAPQIHAEACSMTPSHDGTPCNCWVADARQALDQTKV